MTDTDPFFCTYSGRCISVTNPDPSQIVIEDVARALSNIRRFGGHAHAPLTVAQHSVRVSYLCAHEDAYVGLLHDAQEMVVGDQISPIKKRIAGFKEAENWWYSLMAQAFGLPDELPEAVHYADLVALAEERHILHPSALRQTWWLDEAGIKPRCPLTPDKVWSSEKAYAEFMRRYEELKPCDR